MSEQLDAQLTSLKSAAQQQTATYRTSRDQLHQAIVDAYLWWREADAQKGYLEDTYKAAGIATRKRSSNSPNFYPLVRLVWGIDIKKQAGTVSNWARSMLALHEEFRDNPQLYSNNPRSDLINFIKDEGGLGGVRGEKGITEAELAEEEHNSLAKGSQDEKKDATAAPAAVRNSKLKSAQTTAAKAVISSFPTAVTNTDNLLVMVGRRNAAGKIEIIGSDYSDELVRTALYATTSLDRSSVTPSLRLIAEALEPHALPAKLEKYRKKFFDDSEVERTVTLKELDENGEAKTRTTSVKQATRLRYRPAANDFLISKAIASASLVTLVRPHNQFECEDEVILNGSDRSWVERELLNQQKLTLYSAEPNFGLQQSKKEKKAEYVLQLQSNDNQHERELNFDKAERLKAETNTHPCVINPKAIAWDWQLDASTQWLAEFDAQCATPYINKIRGSFNKAHLASLQLQIGKNALELRYWFDEETKAYADSYTLPYNNNAKRTGQNTGTELFTASAKDLALVFAVLPTLPITSPNVLLAGNSTVMRLKYSTELADYETYIPAADTAGARDATAFEMYGA